MNTRLLARRLEMAAKGKGGNAYTAKEGSEMPEKAIEEAKLLGYEVGVIDIIAMSIAPTGKLVPLEDKFDRYASMYAELFYDEIEKDDYFAYMEAGYDDAVKRRPSILANFRKIIHKL